ncbi:MAG TPA: ISNCY family transposase [Candidatus Acidoferrales bacterium]|nr:ISNCY family transposase [Candidatus Acidoferrales bacterium]
MSKRELERVEVLARVRSRQLRVVDAARLMRVSYRQAKRLWKRYRKQGAAGLKHGSAGRASHRAYEQRFRRRVLQLVREKYGGPVGERFGPTLAAEHLASEDGLKVDAETLRRWMLAEGLWSRERRRRRHRRRRERKEHFGELVQLDGSFHSWLEERGPEGCLIDLVDDATNQTWAQLGEQETIWAVADGLRAWIERYGVPLALYVDWKNLYKRLATSKERLRGEEPVTQFGRMCAKLDIEVIAASSPQAKGRVERIHGVHQDRLGKKLRRKQICSHEHANVYLAREYLPEHNRRFARVAAKPEDFHRRAPRAAELDKIFRLESERTISDDWVVRYDNRWFQLEGQGRYYAPAQGKVLVCERRHGHITIEYRGRALRWQEISAPLRPVVPEASPVVKQATGSCAKRKWVPPANHPWREAARRGEQKKRLRGMRATRPSLALPCASP